MHFFCIFFRGVKVGLGNQYIQAHSIGSYFIVSFIDYAHKHIHIKPQLTDEDKQQISQLINPQALNSQPRYNILFVLVESLESWPIQTIINGQEITPNINHFIENQSVLYCDKIKSEIKKGSSGDGQMIVNTGLLPIREGAACTSFGDNVFPNYAHFYKNSCIVNPAPNVWNQNHITYSYEYKQLIEPAKGVNWNDADVIHGTDSIQKVFRSANQSSCIFVITSNSHAPFVRPDGRHLQFENEMPSCMASYLDCINYVDSCLALIFNSFDLDSTILVVTGDHTIFKDAMLAEYSEYAQKIDIKIKDGRNFCPLIIYSPSIQGNIQVTDTCYQMDIYPTIMHLIGCEDYYWKGFGVNLLDSVARHNRPITEQEAYRLSDLMIRSDYFRQYHSH